MAKQRIFAVLVAGAGMLALSLAGFAALAGAGASGEGVGEAAGEAAPAARTDPRSEAARDAAVQKLLRETPHTEAGGYALYRRGLYPEALAVWEQAANGGDAGAAYRIGATYMDGQAVPQDLDKAIAWLRRAADMGEPRAMGALGDAYDWGIGVTQDRAKAAGWYLKAAERGDAPSQYNAGVFLEDGDVIEQDLVRAYMYYTLADRGGFPKYPAQALEKLTPRLTNDQLKRAIDAARAFKPVPGPAPAAAGGAGAAEGAEATGPAR